MRSGNKTSILPKCSVCVSESEGVLLVFIQQGGLVSSKFDSKVAFEQILKIPFEEEARSFTQNLKSLFPP